MNVRAIISGTLIFILSSCATIINGPTQQVNFSSNPTGARIFVDGTDRGVTPQIITLQRMKKGAGQTQVYAVKIELEGYEPYQIVLGQKVDAIIIGNILLGGLIGLIVDAATGAMYKLKPGEVAAQFGDNSTGMIDFDKKQLYVAVTMKPNPNWEKIGQLTSIK